MYLFTFYTLICYTIIHVLSTLYAQFCTVWDTRKSHYVRIHCCWTCFVQAFLSRKQQTQNNKLLYCTGTTLSWITLHDGSQHWHHHDHQYWHNINWRGTCTDVGTFIGTARSQTHDKNEHVRHDFCFVLFFCFLFLFLAVDFQTEKYARMDDWHYHLETTDNLEDFPGGGGGGLTYSNEILCI